MKRPARKRRPSSLVWLRPSSVPLDHGRDVLDMVFGSPRFPEWLPPRTGDHKEQFVVVASVGKVVIGYPAIATVTALFGVAGTAAIESHNLGIHLSQIEFAEGIVQECHFGSGTDSSVLEPLVAEHGAGRSRTITPVDPV